jgi:hypothetical protein
VRLGSFYAHTKTVVEATLPASLASVPLTAEVRLSDPGHHLAARRSTLPLGAGSVATLRRPNPTVVWLIIAAALALLVTSIVIALVMVGRQRLGDGPDGALT